MFTGYDPAAVPKGFIAAKAATTHATEVHQETPRADMKRHLTGKRKANEAVEPKAETETPTRRVAPRVSYGQLESEVPAVVAPFPAEVPAVVAPSPAPAATPPALDEPALAAAENQWKEEEEHGHVTSAGAAEASTLVEVDRLRQRLAAQERRNAEWQRINLDMLALTQRVMAMAAEGDGGGER